MKKFLSGLLLLVFTGTSAASQDDDFIAARQAFQASGISCLECLARSDEIGVLAGHGCAGENQKQ